MSNETVSSSWEDHYEISAGGFTSWDYGSLAGTNINGSSIGTFIQQRYNFAPASDESAFLGILTSTSSGRIHASTGADNSVNMISKALLQLGYHYNIWSTDIVPYIEGGYVAADTNIITSNEFKPFQSGFSVGGGVDYTLKNACFGKFGYNYCETPQKTGANKTYTINDFIFGLGYRF